MQAVELLGATGRLPGRRAVVWGTHDAALRATLALADAGVAIDCVLETGAAPVGASELLDEIAARDIPVHCQARVVGVAGADRLESATIARGDARETVVCDLLVVSLRIVDE